MKLNNKGFTLVEVLAVVVILSVLIAIMVPSVNKIIEKSEGDNYESLKAGIISAAKVYMSDNRYEVLLDPKVDCDNGGTEVNILKINDIALSGSKLPISWLVDSKDLSTDADGKISNPKNSKEELNFGESYVLVKYQCSTKDYTYTLEDSYLIWK